MSLLPLPAAGAAQAGVAVSAAVLPTGGKVVAGQASIGPAAGSSLTVTQSSGKAIINWNGFSIGSGDKVTFDNGSGATLNRVTGTNVSSLNGLLSATGSLYLLNPNGVIIGKSGVVNVGGTFVASTLNVSNSNFLAGGDLTFTGSSDAAVVNLGKVGALGGDVAMIAATVDNEGSITAANGTVGLVSGYSVLMRDASLDDGMFSVMIGGTGTSVTNGGVIAAANAELRAEGGNVYALAGNTAGVIRATGVSSGQGKVWLVADGGALDMAGTISAQGAGGGAGSVETSGQNVTIGAASVNAHGGTWLLDPTDLEITAAGAADISNALADGDVTEQTTAKDATDTSGNSNNISSSGAGDITLDSGATIAWSSQYALTLSAYHDVDIAGTITSTGTGSLVLRADNTGTGVGTVNFTGTGKQVTASGGGSVSIFYNPAGNDNATVNTTSYTSPTDYTGSVSVTGGGALTAYMLVNTLYDLQNVQNNLSGAYALGTGIDASATAGASPSFTFTPIGGQVDSNGSLIAADEFSGLFDGQGHTISNLTVDLPDSTFVGLFGAVGVNGVVRNVNLAGGSVTGANDVGALAGENDGMVANATASTAVTAVDYTDNGNNGSVVGGLVGLNTGTINLSSASGPVAGAYIVGGLAGGNIADPGVAIIENSFATGTVTQTESSALVPLSAAGGLVGQSGTSNVLTPQLIDDYATGAVTGYTSVGGLVGDFNSGAVTGSYATGNVTAQGQEGSGSQDGEYAGGLIGYLGRVQNSTITNVYATGAVSGAQYVGGLIGWNRNINDYGPDIGTVTITNAYATGAVNATIGAAGGLIGQLNSQSNNYLGPPDNNSNTIISDVFAIGAVSAPKGSGGLVGVSPGAVTITDGYYDSNTTGQTIDAAGGVSMTTAQLQSGLPQGFSPSTWGLIAGSSYPYLLSQFGSGIVPEVISGLAYSSATTPFASGASGAAVVGLVRDGVALGDVTTGANGYFYLLAAPSGSASDGVLAYLASGSLVGNSYTQTSAGVVSGMILQAANVNISTDQPLLSTTLAGAAADIAAAPAAEVVFSADPTAGLSTSNAAITVSVAGSNASGLTVDVPINVAGGLTVAASVGDLVIDQPVSGDLTLSAAQDLEVNSDTVATGELNLVAGSAGTGSGALYVNDGATVSANGGAINIYTNPQAGQTTEANYSSDIAPGGGELVNFIYIYNLAEFESINSDLSGDYALNANINLSGVTNFTGFAGGGSGMFTGVFNGLNHTISNLTLSEPSSIGVGLFGVIGPGGTVENLELSGMSVSGQFSVGALAGKNYGQVVDVSAIGVTISGTDAIGGLVGKNFGSVSGSSVDSASTVTGVDYVGGLVGYQTTPTGVAVGTYAQSIVGSTSAATVSGSALYVGGLLGWNGNGSTVSGSSATGSVTETGGSGTAVGGLVGWNDVDAELYDDQASGVVASDSNAVGGLAGKNYGLIDASRYAGPGSSADVSGYDAVGGLVGKNFGTVTGSSVAVGTTVSGADYVGGLIGYQTTPSGVAVDTYSQTTTNSSSGAAVTGSGQYVGGLVGWNGQGSTLSGSSATGAVTETGSLPGGTAVGGLVGWNDVDASVTDASASGAVASTSNAVGGIAGKNYGLISDATYDGASVSGADSVGGLVGRNFATLTGSSVTGAPTITGNDYVGGLVGFNGTPYGTSATYLAVVSTSYSTANVQASATGPGNDLGGLVGLNGAGATVEVAYATGSVTGASSATGAGGLIGVNQGRVYDAFATGDVVGGADVGGLIGDNAGAVTAAYSLGSAAIASGSSSTVFGGSVGLNEAGGTLTDVYFDTGTSGTMSGTGQDSGSGAPVALSDSAAQDESSYVGFNFNTTWTLDPGPYPTLKALPPP